MSAANLTGIPSHTAVWDAASMSSAWDSVRVEHAAVLFADIIGSTCMSEDWSPAETINFLRSFQQRMAMQVIQHQGHVIQYQGDAIVATFGDSYGARGAPARALSCAFGMLETIAAWSADRSARGELPLSIGIGVHYGAVGIGQIGVEQHLEQAIAGDTVNVARKLEALTRKLGASVVVSDDLLCAMGREAYLGFGVEKLKPNGHCRIAGRATSISTWLLPREALTA